MKKVSPSSAPRSGAAPAAQRKSSEASLALGDSPRMLAQRKQLEGAFGPTQLAAKKDKKLKK